MNKTTRNWCGAGLIAMLGLTVDVNAHQDGEPHAHAQASAAVTDDAERIRAIINGIYDTPEHKVTIDPIVVQDNHAIASWIQQDKGGRALLYRDDQGAWAITLCAGAAVKEVKFLTETGIAQTDAEAMAKGIAAAEAKLGSDKIALFNSFTGIMRNGTKPGHHHSQEQKHSHH